MPGPGFPASGRWRDRGQTRRGVRPDHRM